MSYIDNLQFLNLEDVSKEEIDEINTILYSDSRQQGCLLLPWTQEQQYPHHPYEGGEVYAGGAHHVLSYIPPPPFYSPHTQVYDGMRRRSKTSPKRSNPATPPSPYHSPLGYYPAALVPPGVPPQQYQIIANTQHATGHPLFFPPPVFPPPHLYPQYPPQQVYNAALQHPAQDGKPEEAISISSTPILTMQPPVKAVPINATPIIPPPHGAPISAAPIAGAPISAAPIAGAPISAAPIAGAPISAAPIAGAPISAAPIAGAPISAAPIAGAPISAAPIAGAPNSSSGAPISRAPINATSMTGVPISATSITGAPISASPMAVSPMNTIPSAATPSGAAVRVSVSGSTATSGPAGNATGKVTPSGPALPHSVNKPGNEIVDKPKSNPPLNAIKTMAPPPSVGMKPCKQPPTVSPSLPTPVSVEQAGVRTTQIDEPAKKVDEPTLPETNAQVDVIEERQSGVKSWAGVLKSSSHSHYNGSDYQPLNQMQSKVGKMAGPPQHAVALSRPPNHINPSTTSTNHQSHKLSNPTLHRLAELLCCYELENKGVVLTPRGLNNPSNYCYINAVLQALLACAPFYNLIKAISRTKASHPSTPVIDSMVEFVNEFSVAPVNRLRKERGEKAQARREGGGIDHDGLVLPGPSFEPHYVYKMVHNSLASLQLEARQEDAEEFLSGLLNALNDEMLEIIKLKDSDVSNGELSNGPPDLDNSDWKEVINKGVERVTTRTEVGKTPLTEIFMGQIRSRVGRSDIESTDHIQPFYSLHLDVESCTTVEEALARMTSEKEIEDTTTTTSSYIDHLPLVLILHLKCIHYSNGTLTKISKSLDYPIDLRLANKLVQTNKTKLAKGTNYKLFAVVYHDGKEATKGHYLSDVYHVGSSCWIRYDDTVVRSVSEHHVLKPKPPRVPYLLLYRRIK